MLSIKEQPYGVLRRVVQRSFSSHPRPGGALPRTNRSVSAIGDTVERRGA